MDTCIYEIDYQYHSHFSMAFDEDHVRALVEAPKGLWKDQLEKLCRDKFQGFAWLNAAREVNIVKLV